MEEISVRSNIFSLQIDDIKYDDVLAFCDKQLEEGIDLDYKADWPNDLEKIICSFANTQGGIVLIGVQEEGKSRLPKCPPVGIVGMADVLRQKVLNLSFDAVFPPIVPEVAVCQFPSQNDRFVVIVRVNPSRLMHAVERRTRIYIRSEDSSRGYTLASLPDLRWLSDQRQESQELRETLRLRTRDRADSDVIEFENEEGSRRWREFPLLSIPVIPSFPSPLTSIDLRQLFEVVISLKQVHSTWPNVNRHVPWDDSHWRTIPDGVCLSHRGYNPFAQYVEIGSLGQVFFAYSINSQSAKDIDPRIDSDRPTIQAYGILSYIDISLTFASAFYSTLGLRWPLTIEISIERVSGTVLHYSLGPTNYLNRTQIGRPIPDSSLRLLEREIRADDIASDLNVALQETAQRLFWAYGVSWDKTNVEKWLSNLKGRNPA